MLVSQSGPISINKLMAW